eukprot:315068_1
MGNKSGCNCCPTGAYVSNVKHLQKESQLAHHARQNVIGREIIIKNKSAYELMVRVSSCKIQSIQSKNALSYERQNSYSASIGSASIGGNISGCISNQNSNSDLIEKSVTFSNEDIINEEFIAIKMYSQRKYDGGLSQCYISAYYIQNINENKCDNNSTKECKIWIAENWNVSPNENIFVFDGKEINSESNKHITSQGKYYIITVFDQERSINVKGNKVSVPIEIYSLGHTEDERFNLDPTNDNNMYCNVQNLANGLFWEVKNNQLIQSKDNQQITQQFQFELIPNSATYRIKSRQSGLYLTVNGNVLSLMKWNENNPNQRFVLESHD